MFVADIVESMPLLSLRVPSCSFMCLRVLLVCAAMAMQNLGSPMQLGFPISNYTMSLALLERVDFWDTSEDAIGEDFHMFVKAYFKTHGQVCSSSSCRRRQLKASQQSRGGSEDAAYSCLMVSD